MSTVLFRSLRWQLAGCLLAFSLVTQAQGVKGFSSQTQPSEEIDITRVEAADFYDVLVRDADATRQVAIEAARKPLQAQMRAQEAYDQAIEAAEQAEGTKKQGEADQRLIKAKYKLDAANKAKADAFKLEDLDSPKKEYTQTPANVAASIPIDDEMTLLRLYDYSIVKTGGKPGLGRWHVGILSDGDFNKTLSEGEGNATTPKTGSLGVDAVFMKTVYYNYTYEGVGLKPLVGSSTVLKPRLVFNTLAIIFAQTAPLSTGLTATQFTPERRAFGQALLVPGSNAQGGLSFAVNASYFVGLLQNWFLQNATLDLNLNLTQTRWESQGVTSDVNIFAPMLGGSYRILDENIKVGTTQNQVQVLVFGRYSGRHLFGDIQRYPTILEDALGTRNRTYHGFDVGFTTSINAIRLTVNVPVMEGDIEGFSDGQPVLGLGLAAAIRLN